MGLTGHLTPTELCEIFNIFDIHTSRDVWDTFVETGTYKGHSTATAGHIFKHVYTIEIHPDRFIESQKRLQEYTNIQCLNGDSLVCLPSICSSLTDHVVWFLDAHRSGSDTSDNGVLVPLIQEVECILKHAQRGDHLFIIDDVRLFDQASDWKHIDLQHIGHCFTSAQYRMIAHAIYNDRYCLHVSGKNV